MAAGEAVGPYRVLRRLGQGGMGVVDEVLDPRTNARYALKRLTPEAAVDPELRQRFVREARALAALSHPHLVQVHAAELDGPEPYLVQPLLRGGSLAERLRAGPFPLDQARRVFGQLVEAVAHAHERGVLHRDIKPENVLFDEQDRAVLTDFGLARQTGEDSLTLSGAVVGSPLYMAPEQARDSKETDARADVYALGALLYALLTGRAPFEGRGLSVIALLSRLQTEAPTPAEQLRPDAPPDLVAICARALAKDPLQRWPDAVALRQALGQARRPALALLLIAGLGLTALLLAATVALSLRPEARGEPVPIATEPAPLAREPAPSPDAPSPDTPPPDAPPPDAPPPDAPPPDAPPEALSGDWTWLPLIPGPGHWPQACFDGDQVVVYTGEGFGRCSRWITRRPTQLEPVPGAPGGVRYPATSFLARFGDRLLLGAGQRGLHAWREGRADPPVPWSAVAAARGERWLAVLDHAEGGRVRLLEGGGLTPVDSLPVSYPYCAVFSPDGQELFVGGQAHAPGTHSNFAEGVLARAVLRDGRWALAERPSTYPQNVRGLDVCPERGLLLVADNAGNLVELALSRPDHRAPRGRYLLEGELLTARAHLGTLRGVACLTGEVVVSLAERPNRGAGLVTELAFWDLATHACLERSEPIPGQIGSGLVPSPDRRQALFATEHQVYLVTRVQGD